MVKPSQFQFLPPDPGIAAVAWWGERLMAWAIAIVLVWVRLTTNAFALAEVPEAAVRIVDAATLLYVVVLVKIAALPTRNAHTVGFVLGILTYGAQAAAFIELYASEEVRAPSGNIGERLLLVALIIVFHTWGVWTDRRDLSSVDESF